MRIGKLCLVVLLLLLTPVAMAAPGLPAVSVSSAPGGGQTYSVTLQVLALMTLLTLLPSFVIMMTSFTRIVIVLAILRQAIGLHSAPSNQIILGMALFMTFFIMAPVFSQIYEKAALPYINEKIEFQEALQKAASPIKEFMLHQTRETDIDLFVRISKSAALASPDQTPFQVLLPAFLTSELKTAFQIGFIIFIPFLVIDLVVASILMAMGMMMLSPMMISLPFKIMMFVLVDGWGLVLGTLAQSFYI